MTSPSGGPDETFLVAGLVNPRIIVPADAHVAIQIVNADSDTAHGLVITVSPLKLSWMPMMTARPAFAGSALWFLGNPAAAGLHEGAIAFTATMPGTYHRPVSPVGRQQQCSDGLAAASPSLWGCFRLRRTDHLIASRCRIRFLAASPGYVRDWHGRPLRCPVASR